MRPKLFSTSTRKFALCLVLAYSFDLLVVSSQTSDQFALVTVPDSNLSGGNYLKIYTTQIEVTFRNNNESSFLESVFLNAANQFYNNTTLDGFVEVENIRTTNVQNNSALQVIYDVVYNYSRLLNSVPSDQQSLVGTTIGRANLVQNGLEEDGSFASLYSISTNPTTFRFSGNSICAQATCPQGEFTVCTEVRAGVIATCQSSCRFEFCINNGYCIQSDGNVPPICSCPSTTSTWYLGTHCELFVAVWMPFLFFIAVVLIMVFTVILACCLPVRLRTKRQPVLQLDQTSQKKSQRAPQRLALPSVSFQKPVHKEIYTSIENFPPQPIEPASSSSSSIENETHHSFDPHEFSSLPHPDE